MNSLTPVPSYYAVLFISEVLILNKRRVRDSIEDYLATTCAQTLESPEGVMNSINYRILREAVFTTAAEKKAVLLQVFNAAVHAYAQDSKSMVDMPNDLAELILTKFCSHTS